VDLNVTEYDFIDQEIVADLPPQAANFPGSFLLGVSNGTAQNDTDFFIATIGAVGPQGPAGADGADGAVGPTGTGR
jgi:hypothetical protein